MWGKSKKMFFSRRQKHQKYGGETRATKIVAIKYIVKLDYQA